MNKTKLTVLTVKEVRERNRQGTCKQCLTNSKGLGDTEAMCYRYNYCPISDIKNAER